MIRVVFFLIVLAAIALGCSWIADRPGDVAVNWLGYHVETSVGVAALALLALLLLLMLLFWLLRALLRSPERMSIFMHRRRTMKGYQAVSRGLIAIGAGDQRLARRSADDAKRLTPDEPLTLLLSAQSAQMAGDRPAAERAFRAMTRHEETKLLGLRGLYVEAQRRGDIDGARRAAEQAARTAPELAWAGQAVLDDRCAADDWAGALAALDRMKSGMPKDEYRRKRAVLLTARAQALSDIERDTARSLVLEAVKLAPDLVPAAAMAGRRLVEAGEQRRARKILEAAWKANPHPDIADAYADLRLGDSARERLVRVTRLADMVPGQLEGALAVARAALDAGEFATARAALEPYISAPTRRVATLMAEIEDGQHGDTGRVREWMARAVRASGDPVWTADGVVSDRWLPVSPNGRLDGFEWRVPLAEIGVSRPVVEVRLPPAPEPQEMVDPVEVAAPEATAQPGPEPETAPKPVAAEPAPAADASPDAPAKADGKAENAPSADAAPVPEPAAAPAPRPPEPKPANKAPEPVIPLVHAPDDPGTDIGPEGDTGEPAPRPGEPPDAWHRFRQLFR
ncbi:MAG TPA: heme biosynthesis HemY N-terminal domain-containing protein [Pseudolabrys sp.]|nr:heme biosynthesis HemY N-terminal domain-containing protein [Pseudolabrys sp.]